MICTKGSRRPKKPDSPRVWLRIDHAHVARVIKAKRDLRLGEDVRVMGRV